MSETLPFISCSSGTLIAALSLFSIPETDEGNRRMHDAPPAVASVRGETGESADNPLPDGPKTARLRRSVAGHQPRWPRPASTETGTRLRNLGEPRARLSQHTALWSSQGYSVGGETRGLSLTQAFMSASLLIRGTHPLLPRSQSEVTERLLESFALAT